MEEPQPLGLSEGTKVHFGLGATNPIGICYHGTGSNPKITEFLGTLEATVWQSNPPAATFAKRHRR